VPASVDINRWAEVVKRLVEAKGGEALSLLGPELMPTIVLENDRPEWYALSGSRLWIGRQTLNASVGNFSTIGLGPNPNSPNTLSVCTGLFVETATAPGANIQFTTFSGGALQTNVKDRDSRSKGSPITQFSVRQTGAQAITAQSFILPAGSWLDPRAFWVMRGGQNFLVIESPAVNQALTVVGLGYERPGTADEFDPTV
jgi:hypothetical protein